MALIDQLDPLFVEIYSLLGELAANEAVWSLLDGEENRVLSDGWTREPGYFTIPGTYGFDTPALYVAMHASHPDWDSSPVTNADRERILQDAITNLWNDTLDSWSIGTLKTVYRTASQNIWEPDPSTAEQGVRDLASLTRWLHRQLSSGAGWVDPSDANAPEWLANLQAYWPATSDSPQSFYSFWNDVNDKCGLYLHAAARLASTAAQVTATLSDYQVNLREATVATRDQIVDALQKWQAWKDDNGSWPVGTEEVDNGALPGVMSGISYASGVISLYPPAAVIAGPISVITGTAAYIFGNGERTVYESGKFATASEIHNGYVTDLRSLESNMQSALDAIHTQAPADLSTTGSQGFQSYVADVVSSRGDWSPPSVVL